jgi:hypothetical protein
MPVAYLFESFSQLSLCNQQIIARTLGAQKTCTLADLVYLLMPFPTIQVENLQKLEKFFASNQSNLLFL